MMLETLPYLFKHVDRECVKLHHGRRMEDGAHCAVEPAGKQRSPPADCGPAVVAVRALVAVLAAELRVYRGKSEQNLVYLNSG